ncbi:helix-turn-helix transcriptional regulator [Endozoicomonadaceae bacterium StTr2]
MNTTQKDAEIFSLVPEDYLTASLSPVWQQRFNKALTYIVEHLSEAIDWDQLALHCAVSPSHFQHMFRVIFNEPPGRYLRRMRLKKACYLLAIYPEKPVLDIACEVGFSSSQALAKVLKRDLGMTASDIRSQGIDPFDPNWPVIFSKLGTPGNSVEMPMEERLASDLNISVIKHPEQHFKTRRHSGLGLADIDKLWKKIAPKDIDEQVMLTFSSEVDIDYGKTSFLLGYRENGASANQVIPAGWFLSCKVRIASESGYFAAWHAMYQFMLEHNLTWLDNAVVVETNHNPRAMLARTMDMTLSLSLDENNVLASGLADTKND